MYRRIVEKDAALADFIAYVKTIKAPQMVEWQTLYPKACDGDDLARARIIEMYTRNVLRIALFYSDKYNLPIADVIQDGLLGLMTSIDKFEQAESTTFQTYFPMWVRQFIQREMPQYMYARYFPVHIHERLMAVREIASNENIELPPDAMACKMLLPAICKELELSEDRALQLLSYFSTIESLDVLLEQIAEDDEYGSVPLCLIYDEDMLRRATESDLQSAIQECFQSLSPREVEILSRRNGMYGEVETLEDVGNRFGVTRERIRQIETKAIRKLRHPSRAKKLRDFYLP